MYPSKANVAQSFWKCTCCTLNVFIRNYADFNQLGDCAYKWSIYANVFREHVYSSGKNLVLFCFLVLIITFSYKFKGGIYFDIM